MNEDQKREHNPQAGEAKGEGAMGGGFFVSRNTLLMMAGGALGALALMGLGKSAGKMRPAAVGAVKEGVAFKEWLAARFEKVKEDVEDIVAEGVYEHETEVAAESKLRDREAELLEKIEKMIEAKLAQVKPESKGE